MELELANTTIDLTVYTPGELEELFEDPFSIRFLPDVDRSDGENRYYLLGRTILDRYIFLAFWTDGKRTRVISAREMTEAELRFYQRSYGAIK